MASRTGKDTPKQRSIPATGKIPTSRPRERSPNELLTQIENTMGESWLPTIYRDRILTLRSRSYVFPAPASRRSKEAPEIQHTLLGIELKVGHKRMLCPDLATARYLAVFARAGCAAVAIPYDITRISHLADELDSSWHRMLLLADRLIGDRPEAFATRIRGLLIGRVRDEISAAGAGTRIPEFKQSTKERERLQKDVKETG